MVNSSGLTPLFKVFSDLIQLIKIFKEKSMLKIVLFCKISFKLYFFLGFCEINPEFPGYNDKNEISS